MLAFLIIIVEFIIIHKLKKENRKLKNQITDYEQMTGFTNTVSTDEYYSNQTVPKTEADYQFEIIKSENIPVSESLTDDTASEPQLLSDEFISESVTDMKADMQDMISEKNEKPAHNVSAMFKTGVSMVLIAGLIFVTTNWSVMSSGLKIFIIMLVTGLFFAVSAVSEKILKLEATSKAFYALGSMFIPVTVISMFFFEIFGNWLSFSGEGRFLALMAVFLSCSAGAALLTRKYDTDYSAFIAMFSVSASVFMLVLATELTAAVLLITAAFSYTVYMIKADKLEQLGIASAYVRNYRRFSVINFALSSLASFMYVAAGGKITDIILGMIFLIAATVFMQINSENKDLSIFCSVITPVEYLVMCGLFSSLPDNYIIIEVLNIILLTAAFAVYILVPAVKSGISSAELGALGFLYGMAANSRAVSIASLIMLMICAGLKKKSSVNSAVNTVCEILISVFYSGSVMIIHSALHEADIDKTAMLAVTLCMYAPLIFVFTFFRRFRSGAAVIAAGLAVLVHISECFMAQYGAAAFLVILLGTAVLHFTSDNKNTASVCRILYSLEYIALCVFICASVQTDILVKYQSLTALMYVPAFVIFTFVPELRSVASRTIMTAAQFLVVQCIMQNNTAAAGAVLLAFTVITAFTEKDRFISAVYSAVFPVVLFRFVSDIAEKNSAAWYITLAVTAAAALYTSVRSYRPDEKRYLSLPLVIWTALVPPAAASVRFSDGGFSTILIITCLILALITFVSVMNKKPSSLAASFASADLQMFLVYAAARNCEHGSEIYRIWIIAFIIQAVLGCAAMYMSRRDIFTAKVLAYTSCISTILSVPAGGLYFEDKWLFGFTAMFVFYFISAGYCENHPYAARAEYSAAAVLTGAALVSQMFVTVPVSIRPEYIMTCFAVPYIFLFRIWKENRGTVDCIMFVNAAVDIFILMMLAFSNDLVHSISLGILCVVIIMRAAAVHSRKWMLLGSVSLFILVMYMTRSFWISIAWWVYLMAAGMLLIAYAAYNEYCRKTGQENMLVNKIKSVFKHSVQ